MLKVQVTAKHTCMHLANVASNISVTVNCINWCARVWFAWCTQNLRRDGSSFAWHQPCNHFSRYSKRAVWSYSHSFRECSGSAQNCEALWAHLTSRDAELNKCFLLLFFKERKIKNKNKRVLPSVIITHCDWGRSWATALVMLFCRADDRGILLQENRLRFSYRTFWVSFQEP